VLLLYKTNKRGQWLTVRDEARKWLQERGDLPANALYQIRVKDNAVSVFVLDDGRENTARIVAAILAVENSQSGFISTDLLVFDSVAVERLGIEIREVLGATPDAKANEWHRDLADLSADQVVSLAETLVQHAEMAAVLEAELVEAFRYASAAGTIDQSRVSKKVREKMATAG
jgi:hypothetical protein